MAFQLTGSQEAQLRTLCEKFAVRRLALFGSATGEDFDPDRSDLDFAVEFHLPHPDLDAAEQFFGFKEALQELFGRPVDLLIDRAIKNPYVRRSVDESSVTLNLR